MKKFTQFLNEAKKLKLGGSYSVHEPGMDQWIEDMEYIGYDRNEGQHIFIDPYSASPGSNDIFVMYIPDKELSSSVK